jgi:hypothetical protein
MEPAHKDSRNVPQKYSHILEAVLNAPDAAVDDKAREVPGPTTDEPPVDWLMHAHRDFFLTLTSV